MPTLDDVYRKFGEASETAQLLETELGTHCILARAQEADLIASPNPSHARAIFNDVNRQTLGQLLRNSKAFVGDDLDELEARLSQALTERNRLAHSFYRQHNFRRNSEEGRAEMMRDLEAIHAAIFGAYKLLLKVTGFDLDTAPSIELPVKRVPI